MEISGFLYDAGRFALKNRQIADTALLQLYSSGLMFAPKNSTIKRQFQNELAAWTQLPRVEETWSAEIQILEGHSDVVWSVVFSPGGQLLASCSGDKTIRLWDTNTGELRLTLNGYSGSVRCVAFSPDGQLLASGSSNTTVRLWDVNTGELHHTLEGHFDWVWSEANVELSILDKQWDFFRGKKVLWLPPDFHPSCLVFRAGTLALGHLSGGVSFISHFA